jgi:hypothetical protein
MPRNAAVVLLAYALLAVLVIPVFPHFVSPNEVSRWMLAAAIVEDQSVDVTRFGPLVGNRFEDLSAVDGRLYSNKAPGGTLAGLPGYAIAQLFIGGASGTTLRVSLTAMRLCAATLPALFLGFLLIRAGVRLGAGDDRIVFATFVLLFATPLFAYGLMNFSHALAAACLFGAWVLLFTDPRKRLFVRGPEVWDDRSGRADGIPLLDHAPELAAGALLGMAVLSEYPAAIAVIVLVCCALPRLRVPGLVKLLVGAAPFAAVLAIYNEMAFGNALALSSGHERNAEFQALAQHGLFGIGIPSPLNLLRLLVDPGKGLFVFSPVLLIAVALLPRMARRIDRAAFLAAALTPLAIVLTYAGYPNWHGGWTVGARYLVTALSFLILPLLFGDPRSDPGRPRTILTGLEPALAGASMLAVTLTTLVFPFVPNAFRFPWASFALPLLRHGLVAPNLLHLVAQPLAIAVPFLLCIAAAMAGAERHEWLPFAAGAVLWLVIGLGGGIGATPMAAMNESLQRAYVEELYFERMGALERSAPPGRGVPPRLWMRAENERRLPPVSWPFSGR